MFALFVSEQSSHFLLNPPTANAETGNSEEATLVGNDVYIPLPCEQDDFAQLRSFILRLREELVYEETNTSVLTAASIQAAEAAKKIKKNFAGAMSVASTLTSGTLTGAGVGGLGGQRETGASSLHFSQQQQHEPSRAPTMSLLPQK